MRNHPLAALLGHDEEDQIPPLPLPEAQIEELRTVLREALDEETFTTGDIVEFKRARGPLRPELRGKLVHVFWCYADADRLAPLLEGMARAELQTSSKLDCLVVHMETGNGVVVFNPADSSGLRKVGKIEWRE